MYSYYCIYIYAEQIIKKKRSPFLDVERKLTASTDVVAAPSPKHLDDILPLAPDIGYTLPLF